MIRTSIRRPVAVAMAYTAVALLGVFAWRNIPLEMLPDAELPRLQIRGTWRGASPETVEAFLTSPLESVVQQVPGIERILSESYEEQGIGQADITAEFARGTNMDFARLELSERIAQLEETELPASADPVVVEPYRPDAFQNARNDLILEYVFTGPFILEALREHALDVVKPALEQLDGVSVVHVAGGREREIVVRLDETRALALGLSPAQITDAVAALDLAREAGVVRRGEREWTLSIRNQPGAARDLLDAVLIADGRRTVRVRDVARVVDTFEEPRAFSRVDGNPAVRITVMKEPRSNVVRTAEAVRARVEELSRLNPPGARFELLSDQSERIEAQLTDLRYRAGFAVLVIFAVLLVFLRSFRSAGMVFLTIAFSVLISLNLIYFGGLTLNLLTLTGLAMGFGLIVDNSIVVLENVYRRWQRGEDAARAAEDGTREVVLPILASTATTLIVFVPFVYLQGELRVFYVPLAVVVGLTLLASLFVAFTFIPATAARLLARDARRGRGRARVDGHGDGTTVGRAGAGSGGAAHEVGTGGRVSEAASEGLDVPAERGAREPLYVALYRGMVGLTLSSPLVAILVAAGALAGSYYLFDTYVTRGRVWGGFGDQETYVDVYVRLPRGSDLERTDELTRFFERRIREMPEVERFTTDVYGTSARIHLTFPDSLELTSIPVAIKEQMVAFSLGFSGAEVRVYGTGPSFAYGGGGAPPNYAITVLGYNYERVREIAEDLGRRLKRISRVRDVDTNSSANRFIREKATEFVVEVNRPALARYEMTVADLARGIGAAVEGASTDGTVKIDGEDVRFGVKLRDSDAMSVLELRETFIPGPWGNGVRLGDVVSIYPRNVLARIRRENQQYERTVAYEFRGPVKLGDFFRDRILEATDVPEGYTVKAAEGWRWTVEQQQQIYLVLIVSIVLVYMVTAALFESLLHPFVVLLTVPMALIGVFLIFFYTGASFTREAYVGVIMMGGIVVNNAILLVDHINRLRRGEVLPLREAVLRGTLERVRPILMTTATTVLGLLPLVLFSRAADANIWNALAYTLIGGLLSSTFFVLTTTP
ncbi:MAG: efflux RND transporter permease subunit, partial [Gemmatimonadetes bacterium]